MRKLQDYIILYLKGLCMGLVTVKLGVPAATFAFITRIYEELVRSVRAIDREAIELLYYGRIKDFWEKINGNFVVILLVGVCTSILFFANVMAHVLLGHSILVWSFFFGVILLSSSLVLREIKIWNVKIIFSLLLGIAIAYTITILHPVHISANLPYAFLVGFFATCGLALPGVSATSIVLLTGEYQYIVNAIINLDSLVIIIFSIGCLLGMLTVSRILTWILVKYPNSSLALLAGLTLGGLNKVWPWRVVLEYITNSRGDQVPVYEKSVLPWHYVAETGKDPLVFQAIFMVALGVFIVVLIEKVGARLKTKN